GTRPGLANATEVQRDDEVPFPGKALVQSEFESVGLLAGFVDVERCARRAVGGIGKEHPDRNTDARFGDELQLLYLVALALGGREMFGRKRSVGLSEPEELANLIDAGRRFAFGWELLLPFRKDGENAVAALGVTQR